MNRGHCLFLLLLLYSAQSLANMADYVHVRETLFWTKLYTERYHTLYCAAYKPKGTRTQVTHIYPMQWMARAMACSASTHCDYARFKEASSDLHNLWPVERRMHQKRGNLPFSLPRSPKDRGKLAQCNMLSYPDSVHPREWAKGEIARSMLYIIWKYQLPDYGQLPLMLKWATTYPPNDEELWRNQQIKKWQGNDNIFISTPGSVKQHFAFHDKESQADTR